MIIFVFTVLLQFSSCIFIVVVSVLILLRNTWMVYVCVCVFRSIYTNQYEQQFVFSILMLLKSTFPFFCAHPTSNTVPKPPLIVAQHWIDNFFSNFTSNAIILFPVYRTGNLKNESRRNERSAKTEVFAYTSIVPKRERNETKTKCSK